jgi:secreted PhoX family phosphatase
MTEMDLSTLSFDEFDEMNDPRPQETEFAVLAEKAISRRGFLGTTASFGAAAFLLGTSALTSTTARAAGLWLSFEPVAANTLDAVTVPEGYSWHTVVRWGDPLWSRGDAFDHTTRGTGASQELAFGSNNDGMALFNSGGRSILAVNNEYVDIPVAFANRKSGKPETADDVRKGKAAHGVSIIEIEQNGKFWSLVKDSPFNRRITADTPMEITGPARGHRLMHTAADPNGTLALGTWNNCGNGRTPWGTYLTCEENFNGYFSSSDPNFQRSDDMKRYGVGLKDRGYAWAAADERFDISKHPNEPNRFGYIVEIDPLDPTSTPKKRTALGRFKHENAELVVANNRRVVVYLGDDERGEFLYRFVSEGRYVLSGDNRDLLANGRLYVAKFDDRGRGEWLELTPQTTGFSSQAEISIHTRQAASKVGATTMDRPEWVAVNPTKVEAYCSLTNNKNRGKTRQEAERRWRRDTGRRPQPARGQCVRSDPALATR